MIFIYTFLNIFKLSFLTFIAVIIISACSTSETITDTESDSISFEMPETVTAIAIERSVQATGDTTNVPIRLATVILRDYPDYFQLQSFTADARGIVHIPMELMDLGSEYILEVRTRDGTAGTNIVEWDEYYRDLYLDDFIPIIIGQNIRIARDIERSRMPPRVGDPRSVRIN